MTPLRVGILGCGRIAQLMHLRLLREMDVFRVVGLAELNDARRTEARKSTPTATAYADYRDLLADPTVEAVFVCLPTPLHATAAADAFGAEKHVYLEKPIATTRQDAVKVLNAQSRARTVGMMGLNFRFSPQYERARTLLKAGAIGDVVAARSIFSTAARDLPAWKQTRESGGGVLLDLATHHADLTRFLFDTEAEHVHAHVTSQLTEADNAALTLTLASGLTVQSFFSMTSIEDHRFEIFGQDGRLTVDLFHLDDVAVTGPSLQNLRRERIQRALRPSYLLHTPTFDLPFRRSLAAFAKAVRNGSTAFPNLRDGLRSLAIVEAAETSAQSGRATPVRNVRHQDPALEHSDADPHSTETDASPT